MLSMMDSIKKSILSCQSCPLHKTRKNAVPGDGNPKAKVLLIGEAPGREEDLQGRPFVGPAGEVLDYLLQQNGYTRDDVFITNIVCCRPPGNRNPTRSEAQACSKHLVSYIETIHPELIVLLGGVALSVFFGGYRISQVSGKLLSIGEQRFLPLYHPATALYQRSALPKLEADYRALSRYRVESTPDHHASYNLTPHWGLFSYGLEPLSPESLEKAYLDGLIHRVAIDTETTNLRDKILIGVGIAVSRNQAVFIPRDSAYHHLSMKIIEDRSIIKIYHNSLYDIPVLREYCNPDVDNVVDTLTIANLLGLPRALSQLAPLVGAVAEPASILMSKKTTGEVTAPIDVIARKCCMDAIATLTVYEELHSSVDSRALDRELRILPILMKMSARGIKIDQDLRQQLEYELSSLESYLRSTCEGMGFNPGSPFQVGYMLSSRGAYLPLLPGRKWLNTEEETLERLRDPVAAVVLQWRRARKTLSTYIMRYKDVDRVHSRFHVDAATARISSADPNLQNIPSAKRPNAIVGDKVRNLFLPDSGVWTDLDWSQIEPRILAHISNDRAMKAILDNPKGDIHRATAAVLYGIPEDQVVKWQRERGKVWELAVQYGAEVGTLMEHTKIRDPRLVADMLRRWRARFPQAYDWIMSTMEWARFHNEVYTLFGRAIKLPEEPSVSLGEKQRKAVNYPIQGSNADGTKEAMLALGDLDVALQVYDQILIDGYVEDLEQRLGGIYPFYAPIKIHYKDRWDSE